MSKDQNCAVAHTLLLGLRGGLVYTLPECMHVGCLLRCIFLYSLSQKRVKDFIEGGDMSVERLTFRVHSLPVPQHTSACPVSAVGDAADLCR